VRTKVVGGSRVKIEHEYEVVVVERGGKEAAETAAVAGTTLACVDREGRPMALPGWLATGREAGAR
jgi:acyl-CoA thioesterase FadM